MALHEWLILVAYIVAMMAATTFASVVGDSRAIAAPTSEGTND
jgi:hypothetical protein